MHQSVIVGILFCVKDLVKSYADDLDRIEREYKQRMRKSEAAFNRRYNDISSQMKSQQVPSSLLLFVVTRGLFI